MQAFRVLEYIRTNRIEELIAKLKDEIYTNSLKGKPNAKKRYSAMKKYFKYADSPREVCQKPCLIEFEGKAYTSFTNSYSLALTTEDTGEIELFDTENGTYPDISRLVNTKGEEGTINFAKVIAEAKTQGYKLLKSYFFSNVYLMRYKDAYFRIPLVELTYNIIADSDEAAVYYNGRVSPLVIKNDIGIAVILPVRYDSGDPEENGNTVIDASPKEDENETL